MCHVKRHHMAIVLISNANFSHVTLGHAPFSTCDMPRRPAELQGPGDHVHTRTPTGLTVQMIMIDLN